MRLAAAAAAHSAAGRPPWTQVALRCVLIAGDSLLAISIPILLHSFVFRTSGLVTLPSIILIGPSGSGKTSLLTLVLFQLKSGVSKTDIGIV